MAHPLLITKEDITGQAGKRPDKGLGKLPWKSVKITPAALSMGEEITNVSI